jgi:hypothetical protein
MTNIEDYFPHEMAELICLKCLNRAVHVYPSSVMLKDLECKCGAVGFLIKTGQNFDDCLKTESEGIVELPKDEYVRSANAIIPATKGEENEHN